MIRLEFYWYYNLYENNFPRFDFFVKFFLALRTLNVQSIPMNY